MDQAFGQVLSSRVLSSAFGRSDFHFRMAAFQAQVRQQVEGDRLARAPVARELQEGGAAQPFVRKQNGVRKRGAADCDRRDDRNAGQVPVALDVRGLVGQRHQRRSAGNDRQAELRSNFIAEARGACPRVRQAAGRYDQRGSGIRGRSPCAR